MKKASPARITTFPMCITTYVTHTSDFKRIVPRQVQTRRSVQLFFFLHLLSFKILGTRPDFFLFSHITMLFKSAHGIIWLETGWRTCSCYLLHMLLFLRWIVVKKISRQFCMSLAVTRKLPISSLSVPASTCRYQLIHVLCVCVCVNRSGQALALKIFCLFNPSVRPFLEHFGF